MLHKIVEIKNVGRFRHLKHKAPEFRNLALVFGQNGFGKSTVSSTIRSASTGDAQAMKERRHLGHSGPSCAKLKVDGKEFVYESEAWKGSIKNTFVFDNEYVRSNVHVGEEVTIDNKRKLLSIILGEEGVKISAQVFNLDQRLKGLTRDLRTSEKSILNIVPSVSDVDVFCTMSLPHNLKEKIAETERTVRALERESDVATAAAPEPIIPQAFDIETTTELLGRTSTRNYGELRKLLDVHLEKHALGENGFKWLKYGHERTAKSVDSCPFCDQSLEDNRLMQAYDAVFTEDHAKFAKKLEEQIGFVESIIREDASIIRSTIADNLTKIIFWRDFIDIADESEVDAPDGLKLSDILSRILQKLKIKRAHPFEPVDAQFLEEECAKKIIEDTIKYNEFIADTAKKIAAAKGSFKDRAANPEAWRNKLTKWRALEARDQEPLKTETQQYLQIKREIKTTSELKESHKENLRSYVERTAKNYERKINELLDLFGCSFSLCKTKASFMGREPNSDYCLSIDGNLLKVGGSGQRKAPSFKTVLSSGDKATLALALFIAQVQHSSNLKDAIVVLDDPFNSQDIGRQFETASQIRLLAANAKQVIVLSHDARFLHMIHKDVVNVPNGTYQITCDASGVGQISEWDLEEEIKDEYFKRAERIKVFAAEGKHIRGSNDNVISNDLRVFVEEYLKVRFPGDFPKTMMMNEMINKIKDEGHTHPLHSKIDDLRSLNEFGRQFHHPGTAPDPLQLRAKCRHAVRIVKSV